MRFARIIALIAVTIASLTLCSSCQQPQKEQISAAKVKPEKIVPKTTPIIQVVNSVHDFGNIGPSTKNTGEFEFKNIGDGTLVIKKVHSTCSCSVGKLEKNEYLPGESGTITASYRASSVEGAVKKHLFIESNDPKNPRSELTLKANIELKVAATPKNLNLLLNEENAGVKPITLKSKDGKEFSIKNFSASNKALTAEFDPTVKATEFTLTPQANIEKLQKTANGSVRISLDHPECKSLSIRFTAKPLFEVSKPRIIIQNAEPGKPVVKDVWVKSNYGQSFEIESITSEKNYMTVLNRQKQANNIKLQIQVIPPPRTSQSKRYITDKLNIKIKDADTLTISCSGWYALKQKG
jgi:hypothetical protein